MPSTLSTGRRIAVWACIVLAGLIAFVSAMTIWVKRQALETDNWVDTSTALLEDDEIRSALSIYLVDQLYASVDVSQEIRKALPADVKPLAGPIAGGLYELAIRTANTILSRPRVQTLWEEANRKAHQRLIQVIDDKGDLVATGGGDVVLDLRPLVQQLGQRLGVSERIEQRLGPNAGQIVLMRSDQLDTIQTIVKILRKLSVWLAFAMVALFALAVFLAQGRRRETLRAVGFTLIIVGLLLLVVRRLVGNYLVDYLTNSTAVEKPTQHVWLIGTDLLAGVAWTGIIYGLVVVLAAVLAGPTRAARWVRGHAGPTMRDRPGLYFGLVALVYGLLLLWGPTPAFRQPLWILVFGVLLAVGAEAFRRLSARELPTAG